MTRERSTIHDTQLSAIRMAGGTLSAIFIGFLLLPMFIVVPLSFTGEMSRMFDLPSWSLDLYRAFLSSADWTGALANSAFVAVCASMLTNLLALPAAYGLVRYEFPFKRALLPLFSAPAILPSVIIALGMYVYFGYMQINGTYLAIILAHSVYVFPFALIILFNGMRRLDRNVEIAAELMGATRARIFLTVVAPQLYAQLAASSAISFLLSFDEVVISWFLTGVETATLPVKMYSAIQWEVSPVIAAISTILMGLSLLVCGLLIRLRINV